MLQKLVSFLIVSLSLLACTKIQAQTYYVNSPYTLYGIGTIHPTAFSANKGMGSIGAAYHSLTNVNYNNPASYSKLKLTTLETAIIANGLWISDNGGSNKTGTGSLGYLAFGFPIMKFWGSSVGLIPHNSISYDLQDIVEDETVGSIDYRFGGSGQSYQFYWGNGFKFKGFSAGFNIAYLFGTMRNQIRSDIIDVDGALTLLKSDDSSLGDFIWNIGFQYDQKIKDDVFLTIGLSGNSANKVKTDKEEYWIRGVLLDDFFSPKDTVATTLSESGNITLPGKINAGIMLWQKGDWKIGLDYTLNTWESFRNFGEVESAFVNSSKIAVGFEFTPESRISSKFFKASNYRLGGYYDNGSLELRGVQLSEFAFTMGIGMPIRKVNSRLNFAFEIGQRGSLKNDLVKENFFNATIGFTLNDKWFTKSRYE